MLSVLLIAPIIGAALVNGLSGKANELHFIFGINN
jgi:hypothetical protein